jgi:hypothetical protein
MVSKQEEALVCAERQEILPNLDMASNTV